MIITLIAIILQEALMAAASLAHAHTHTDKLAIKGGGQLNAMLFGEPLTTNKA